MNTMKHSSNNSNHRRSRPRGNTGKRHNQGGGGHNRNTSYESNGPDVKVRGTAQQILEKYQTLARDATSAGDHITAEALHQFAEHYHRIVAEDKNSQQNSQNNPRRDQQNNSGNNPNNNSGQQHSQKQHNQKNDVSANEAALNEQVQVQPVAQTEQPSVPATPVTPAAPVQEIPIVMAEEASALVAAVETPAEAKPAPVKKQRTRTVRSKPALNSDGEAEVPAPKVVKPRVRKPRVKKEVAPATEEAASADPSPVIGDLL